ncbi:MAG: nitrilase-related carbon-nitrogen hydrolase, partial [Curtobacterium sp.]
MGTLTIAAAQFAPVDDPAANLDTIQTFAADIDVRFAAAAQPLDGPFVTGLRQIARDTGLALVVGVAETADVPGRFRNTLVTVRPDGTLDVAYRKVHLYDAFGARESDRIEAGDPGQLAVFELAGVRVGLETCYDLRFPEVTRRLAAPQ